MLGRALQDPRDPCVEVAGVATFDEHREARRREAARDVARLGVRAQLRAQLLHERFHGERADLALERRDLVRLEVDDRAQAGLHDVRELVGRLLHE